MAEALFGPAGNSDSFAAMGYTKNTQVPAYLARFGLTAFEYQCGHGIQIGEESAAAFGAACAEGGITVSMHAPYYISMANPGEEPRRKSVDYIVKAAACLNRMGGRRIIFHVGSYLKQPPAQALALAKDTMSRACAALDEAGLSHMLLCPEVMGKHSQLGTVEEVLALCRLDNRVVPCVDFGHLNARTGGGLAQGAAYAAVLDTLAQGLGDWRSREFHAHFSKIEYTAAGERRHLTFADQIFGPAHEPLMDLLARRGLCPTVICESAGTQAEDAAAMAARYAATLGQNP